MRIHLEPGSRCLPFILTLLSVFSLSCQTGVPSETTLNDGRAALLENYLQQGKETCEMGIECFSRVCEYGTCAGLLSTDDEGAQVVILEALMSATEKGDINRGDTVKALKKVATMPGGDPLVRARAARGLAAMSSPSLHPLFLEWLKADGPLQYWGAVGLATAKPDQSLAVLRKFLGARSEALVLRTLGVLKTMKLDSCPDEAGVLACGEMSPRVRNEARALMLACGAEPLCAD